MPGYDFVGRSHDDDKCDLAKEHQRVEQQENESQPLRNSSPELSYAACPPVRADESIQIYQCKNKSDRYQPGLKDHQPA